MSFITGLHASRRICRSHAACLSQPWECAAASAGRQLHGASLPQLCTFVRTVTPAAPAEVPGNAWDGIYFTDQQRLCCHGDVLVMDCWAYNALTCVACHCCRIPVHAWYDGPNGNFRMDSYNDLVSYYNLKVGRHVVHPVWQVIRVKPRGMP